MTESVQTDVLPSSDRQAVRRGQGVSGRRRRALAWALRCPDARLAADLVESYHEERFPIARQVIRTTDRAFNLVSGSSWFAQIARGLLAPLGLRALSLLVGARPGRRVLEALRARALLDRHRLARTPGG